MAWSSLRLINRKEVYEKRKLFKPGCSKIENIPYNLIFTAKLNASSILISIISWNYLNYSFSYSDKIDDVTIYTNPLSCKPMLRTSQSDCSIHIKLNY